jgi:hypothetical protein
MSWNDLDFLMEEEKYGWNLPTELRNLHPQE